MHVGLDHTDRLEKREVLQQGLAQRDIERMDDTDAARGLGFLHVADPQHHGGVIVIFAFVEVVDHAAAHDYEGRP